MLAHVCISELNELFLILFSNFMSKDSEIHNGKKNLLKLFLLSLIILISLSVKSLKNNKS